MWESVVGARRTSGFWLAGVAGALLTSLYTFRLIFLVFFGPVRNARRRSGQATR